MCGGSGQAVRILVGKASDFAQELVTSLNAGTEKLLTVIAQLIKPKNAADRT